MRYALIIAGGSGTRLWPMSRAETPKQLIPLIDGKSLLRVAWDRLDGLVPVEQRYICAGDAHRDAMLEGLPGLTADRYIGEPMGRDTLNAIALGAVAIAQQDPDPANATIAVFTADHVIEPIDAFQKAVARGYDLAEAEDTPTLVTFGIKPRSAATGYGYLQLGDAVDAAGDARIVDRFKEKPDEATAKQYLDAGPTKYLWNSGMFVWQAQTLLDCVEKYEPDVAERFIGIVDAWNTDHQDKVLADVYPTLKKTSVDFGVMEPASDDPDVRIAAVPMDVSWLDVGSWLSLAQTCTRDEAENALAAKRHIVMDCRNTLVFSSDPDHLVAAIGCDDMVVVHTPEATLVCPKDQAQRIKELHATVKERFGDELA